MKKATVLAILVALVASSASAFAQQRSRLRGKVVDSGGNPVAGAEVRAENPVSMPAVLNRKSNKKGEFVFNGVQVGEWTLLVSADSFIPSQAKVQVGVNENVEITITLENAQGSALLATSGKAQEEIEQARQRFDAGDFEGAIGLYNELLAKAPEVYQIHFNLALAHEKNGDFEEAAEHFVAFLEHEPSSFDAALRAANAFSRAEDKEKAVTYYRRAAEIQPQDAVVYFNLGLALFDLERLDDAVGAFERTLSLDSRFADAHYMLANIHVRNRDLERARASYEKFLELAPDSPNAEAARTALEQLKES
ncbi:MAG TPA: tetratricopeptide repeat protein [Vicinamibacteria bacterium]|nr:tetratricopeptide repeat protein [Vicinamibacteria bacterium]